MALAQQTSAKSQRFTSTSTAPSKSADYTQDQSHVSKPPQATNTASPSSTAEAAGTSPFTPGVPLPNAPCSPLPRNASRRPHEAFAPY